MEPYDVGRDIHGLLLGCSERGMGSTRYLNLVREEKQLHASKGRKEGTTDTLKL